jgi:hypothetical protein
VVNTPEPGARSVRLCCQVNRFPLQRLDRALRYLRRIRGVRFQSSGVSLSSSLLHVVGQVDDFPALFAAATLLGLLVGLIGSRGFDSLAGVVSDCHPTQSQRYYTHPSFLRCTPTSLLVVDPPAEEVVARVEGMMDY